MEVQDRIARGAEHRALIGGGQKAGAPLRGAGEGTAPRILNDDESGKALVLAAQAVRNPRTHGGKTSDDGARIPFVARKRVIEGPALRRVNERQVVHDATDFR